MYYPEVEQQRAQYHPPAYPQQPRAQPRCMGRNRLTFETDCGAFETDVGGSVKIEGISFK